MNVDDWSPLPRRWPRWPLCALLRHRVVGRYCRCRAVISFPIVGGGIGWGDPL